MSNRPNPFFYLAILLLITLGMVFFYGQIPYEQAPYSGWDLSVYRKMAQAAPLLNPSVPQPYAYRLLGPYLVGLFRGDETPVFYLFSVIASVALAVALFYFLKTLGVSRAIALITSLLFIFNKHFFGFTLWDYFQTNDVLSLLITIVLFWSLLSCRWLIFMLALAAGALCRETSMLLALVALFFLIEQRAPRKEILKFLAACLPAFLIFSGLRLWIEAPGPSLLQAFLLHLDKWLKPDTWFRLLINAFLPLSFFPLVFYPETLDFFRQRKYAVFFLLLILLSTFFGTDHERLMAPTFVIYYWLVATILEKYSSRWFLILVLGCTFLASFHQDYGRFLLPNRLSAMVLGVTMLSVVTAAAVFRKLAGHGNRNP